MRWITAFLVGAALALAVGACSDDDDDGAAETTTSRPRSSTTTTDDATTTSGQPTTTAGSGECADAPRSAGVAFSEAGGDVNGDGAPDIVVVYGAGDEADPNPWRLRVELDGGGTVEADIAEADAVAGARALGATPLAGPAGDVIMAQVGAGASATIVGLWVLEGCELLRLSRTGGIPSLFAVGGSVTHLAGLSCVEGRLIELTATSTDGVTYETTETEFVVRDANLELNGSLSGTLQGTDPTLGRYATITCPGVTTP